MATGAGSARQKPQPPELQTPLQPDTSQLEEQIRFRAYEIWSERDGWGGSAMEDWLQAEKEILNEK